MYEVRDLYHQGEFLGPSVFEVETNRLVGTFPCRPDATRFAAVMNAVHDWHVVKAQERNGLAAACEILKAAIS
jgi:hypothetical protein